MTVITPFAPFPPVVKPLGSHQTVLSFRQMKMLYVRNDGIRRAVVSLLEQLISPIVGSLEVWVVVMWDNAQVLCSTHKTNQNIMTCSHKRGLKSILSRLRYWYSLLVIIQNAVYCQTWMKLVSLKMETFWSNKELVSQVPVMVIVPHFSVCSLYQSQQLTGHKWQHKI